MNQEYTSIIHRGPYSVPSAGTPVRLDPINTIGRRNITITNISTVDVYVRRNLDEQTGLSDFVNPHVLKPTVEAPVVFPVDASALLTDYTYRIPAGSTLDDPCGDNVYYTAAFKAGTTTDPVTVLVQECF